MERAKFCVKFIEVIGGDRNWLLDSNRGYSSTKSPLYNRQNNNLVPLLIYLCKYAFLPCLPSYYLSI